MNCSEGNFFVVRAGGIGLNRVCKKRKTMVGREKTLVVVPSWGVVCRGKLVCYTVVVSGD